jgi:hypothetical protein
LAQADDVGVHPGYVVHPGDGPVLARLADEHHRPLPVDVDHGAIFELDRASDARIELCERVAITSHVIGCAQVKVPDALLGVTLLCQVDMCLPLHQEEARLRGSQLRH